VRKRIALGVSIPAVILFLGLLIALLLPSNLLVVTEALDRLGWLGGRERIDGLIQEPPGRREAGPLVLLGGRLWDAQGGSRPNPGLCASGGRIQPCAERPAPGARIVDISGMTALPGLIDMHIHSLGGGFAGEMMIGNGVTSARDLGTQLAGVLRHRHETEEGSRLGPRLFVSGPYLVGGGGAGDQEIGVTSPEGAARLVERFAQAGVDGIKVHTGIDAPTLRAVVAAARGRMGGDGRAPLWVAAHLDLVSAADAAAMGVSTIEHASGIDLGVGLAATRHQDEAIAAMVAHGVALTPTVVVAEHAFTLPRLARGEDPAQQFVPRFFRRFWISSQIANAAAAHLTDEETARRRGRLERLERFVARFHAAGGRVLAGTDAPAFLVAPGFDIHRELELLAEAGLGAEAALKSATSEAAAALGYPGELGGLSPGMRADIVVVAGDPFEGPGGIRTTRNVVLVVKDGRVMLDRLH